MSVSAVAYWAISLIETQVYIVAFGATGWLHLGRMENLIFYIFMGILIIGVIAVGVPFLLISAAFWWVAIPIVGFWLGGVVGFVFGVGLVVIIFGLFATISSDGKKES